VDLSTWCHRRLAGPNITEASGRNGGSHERSAPGTLFGAIGEAGMCIGMHMNRYVYAYAMGEAGRRDCGLCAWLPARVRIIRPYRIRWGMPGPWTLVAVLEPGGAVPAWTATRRCMESGNERHGQRSQAGVILRGLKAGGSTGAHALSTREYDLDTRGSTAARCSKSKRSTAIDYVERTVLSDFASRR